MSTKFDNSPDEMADEQLIKLHKQIKSEIDDLKALGEHIDNEIRRRIHLSGPLVTPAGKAEIILRKLKSYSPAKVFGVLGLEKFLKVISVSSSKIHSYIKLEPYLEKELEKTYEQETIEVLSIK
jgi:hypothetical protein